ncbi:MAG: hypothetical protein U0821_15205 [Chloroflexota bacterium]
MIEPRPPLHEYLPDILGQDDFTQRFIAAFGETAARIQAQLDHLPDLFTLAHTPFPSPAFDRALRDGAPYALRAAALSGERAIELDVTEGLRPGAELSVEPTSPDRAEHVTVATLPSRAIASSGQRQVVVLAQPLRHDHAVGSPVHRGADTSDSASLLAWLGGWLGVQPRADRGTRWNRAMLRESSRYLDRRGTRVRIQSRLAASLAGDARVTVVDPSAGLRVGSSATLGVDTALRPSRGRFWVDLHLDPGSLAARSAAGVSRTVNLARQVLRDEAPAHVRAHLRLLQTPMRLGTDPSRDVGVRVGRTSLIWDRALAIPAHG